MNLYGAEEFAHPGDCPGCQECEDIQACSNCGMELPIDSDCPLCPGCQECEDPSCPPQDVIDAWCKACHCCRDCDLAPCGGVQQGGVCENSCRCDELDPEDFGYMDNEP